MKKYYIFFLSINQFILIAGFIAFIIVLLMDIWLFNIPELFNKAHIIGKLIYSICLSIIAATFFYIITVQVREYKERRHIYPYVKKKLLGIISTGKNFFDAMATNTGVIVNNKFPNEDELEQICARINPKSTAPLQLVGGNSFTEANWYQYFLYHVNLSLKMSTHITNNLTYLNPELIELIRQFEENRFFSTTEFLTKVDFANTDLLESHKNSFLEYIKILTEIERYVEKNFKYY